MRLRRRLRALAFRELFGPNGRTELGLVVSGKYFKTNERTYPHHARGETIDGESKLSQFNGETG